MFNLQDESITRVKHDSPVDRMDLSDEPEQEKAANPLDSDESHQRFDMLISYYRQELERQAENRAQQATDEDYYDHIQHTENEVQELNARGQAVITYNVIAQTLNWIIGSEKRGRTDFKILPRGKEDAKPAESKTKYLKYLSDVNRTPFHRSRSFEDAAKVGIGWIECGVQDEDDGEPIYDRHESWRNMLWDSASTDLSGEDCRYQFRSRWVDEDIGVALFPERAEMVRRAVSDTGIYSASSADGDDAMDAAEEERENDGHMSSVSVHRRRRLRLIEAWYRMPTPVKKMRGGAFNGQIHDENDPRHAEDVQAGRAVLVEKVMMRTRVAIMTIHGFLFDDVSPYKHNRFKFIPIWAYRRGRDGMPYGVIRGLRSIQDGINKRASKALYIMSTNKVIMDEGAVEDMDLFAEEISRPDAIIVKKTGKTIDINVDRELVAPHIEQQSRDISMIQQVGGVTDEQMGKSTNATSGVAIQARQDQGSLSTSKLFDNLRLAVQMHGEIQLSLCEQYVTDQKEFRITNQRGTPEFVTVNDGLPENDITRTKADFVISEADWRATMRQAATQQLTDMMMKMPPEVALVMLDLVVESMDIDNRDEMVKRIRQLNGQRDPDATEPTPEEQQAMQQQAEQQAIQMEGIKLEMGEKTAKIGKLEAETARIKRQAVDDSMNAANTAMMAATSVLTMPTIAKVADNLLKDAGWAGAHIVANGLPPMQPPQPPPQPDQMQQPVADPQQPEPAPEMAQAQPPQEGAPA